MKGRRFGEEQVSAYVGKLSRVNASLDEIIATA
jgi:hypothetical protein